MMRMSRNVFLVLAMACETSGVSIHSFFDLLVRIALVHGMAVHTSKFALLITGALSQPVKFAPRHANHSIRPKEAREFFGMRRHEVGYSRLFYKIGRANERCGFFEIVAGAIGESIFVPVRGFLIHFHAVAISADLGRTNVVQMRRLDDIGCHRARIFPVASALPFKGYVRFSRPVASLAGDSQLGHMRVIQLLFLLITHRAGLEPVV